MKNGSPEPIHHGARIRARAARFGALPGMHQPRPPRRPLAAVRNRHRTPLPRRPCWRRYKGTLHFSCQRSPPADTLPRFFALPYFYPLLFRALSPCFVAGKFMQADVRKLPLR